MSARFAWCGAVLVIYCAAQLNAAAVEEAPIRYIMEYPAAQQFCPPVAGFFDEVQRTIDRVGNHTFRHQSNGGYGLPVQDKVGGAHLLHLGADVGWYRVGDPVYAVANGVVRISEGPPPKNDNKKNDNKGKPKSGVELSWGNLVVVEHELADGKYATTIYGHLDGDRLVKAGDVVRAGQQIGMIGATRVNGGYKPHLHFGVRTGRMAEVGRKLMGVVFEGKQAVLTIDQLGDDKIVLGGADELPDRMNLTFGEQKYDLIKRDGKAEISASILSHVQPTDFPIVGYALSIEGWQDPIAFLREHGAEAAPAVFDVAQRRRKLVRTAAATAKNEVEVAEERE